MDWGVEYIEYLALLAGPVSSQKLALTEYFIDRQLIQLIIRLPH